MRLQLQFMLVLSNLIVFILTSCTVSSPPQTAQIPETVFFTSSSAEILNPERGFFQGVVFKGTDYEADDLTSYASLTGDTVAYFSIRLDDYRNKSITPEYLNGLDFYFQLARDAGIKYIVRVSYNFGPTPNSEPDASLTQVLRHIEQLAPTFEKNKDVIMWFEAGFIGAWGEWHTSTNGLDTPENKAIIRDVLFSTYPKDRAILFRHPADFTAWYPQPLTAEQAFGSSPQARLGHHNDCFLASNYDGATYLLPPNYEVVMFAEWQAYISQMTRFVPMSGETCEPNPPRSDCPTALQEMEIMHWTALNDLWHPDVIQGWKNQGCYTEIRNRLGYRLTLLEAEYNSKVQSGNELFLRIRLQNTGFASPLLMRPVYLLLVNKDESVVYQQAVDIDPRRWEYGVHTFNVTLALPENLLTGTYNLSLWLPDPAANLQNDPRYAIQFANQNTWDEKTGWNIIGEVLVIE